MKVVTREKRVMARVTNKEKKKLERLAKKHGMTESSYIRFLIQGAE